MRQARGYEIAADIQDPANKEVVQVLHKLLHKVTTHKQSNCEHCIEMMREIMR